MTRRTHNQNTHRSIALICNRYQFGAFSTLFLPYTYTLFLLERTSHQYCIHSHSVAGVSQVFRLSLLTLFPGSHPTTIAGNNDGTFDTADTFPVNHSKVSLFATLRVCHLTLLYYHDKVSRARFREFRQKGFNDFSLFITQVHSSHLLTINIHNSLTEISDE